MSNYAVVPLYYYNDLYMQKDYVKGVYANAFATKFFMYAEMENGADTLRINLASEPDYLDPALNSSVDGACLAANSFSGLYTYDSEGKPVPACADSYEVSEDGLTYTVKLKEGLKWSDGSDLTAEDFVYSWKRAVDPKTAADYEYMFSGFDGYGTEEGINVTAVDATTLQFVLAAPCAYMEDLMAFPT
ncbi:MAG: peptide ABC transporter substrate-binding protein, partial [Clostridium sp.]|nr:peptide ABC transporter substrate-binding protein [Clostridium sp.]